MFDQKHISTSESESQWRKKKMKDFTVFANGQNPTPALSVG